MIILKEKQQELHDIVAQIGMADSLSDSVALFIQHKALLCNCTFILSAKEELKSEVFVNLDFSCAGAIRGLFGTNKVVLLDQNIAQAILNGTNSTLSFDYSISLDTQTLSYLEPYIQNKKNKIPKDFMEVFKFIMQPNINIDPMPYVFENFYKQNSPNDYDKFFLKYKYFVILKTLDQKYLCEHNKLRSTLSETQINMRTQQELSRMYYESNDGSQKKIFYELDVYYCLLLQMALIHFCSYKLTALQKTKLFIEFTDRELATIFLRESIIAHTFFQKGNNLKFFSSVQLNNSNVLKKLRNMAWDLWHIRHLERMAKPSKEISWFFPSFVTFDKGLIEIIDLCPLRAHAYIYEKKQPFPFYDNKILDTFNDALPDEFSEQYFSDVAAKSRCSRRTFDTKQRIKILIDRLELEIKNYTRACP
ncbi:MAG: hypothetical protein NXI01_10190 [Gammaproteobacteria bacterium]|nr:hypothetical protein [Gammaproteobacteria bacterium]